MDETYHFEEKSERAEGREAMDDIDAFEARMRGEAPARKAAPSASAARAKENKPKPSNGKKGADYVSAAVKAPKMTEAQQDAADARSAVADLAKFEQRVG